jgi:hypothetical protein
METKKKETAETPLVAYVTPTERRLLVARAKKLDTSLSKLIRTLVQQELASDG